MAVLDTLSYHPSCHESEKFSLERNVSTEMRHCSFSSLLYRITCRHREVTHACYMAQEKGTMNKLGFLLTRSNEKGNNSVQNVNTLEANGDAFKKLLLCSSDSSEINFVHTKLFLPVCIDSSPFPAWPPFTWAFLLAGKYLYTRPF